MALQLFGKFLLTLFAMEDAEESHHIP